MGFFESFINALIYGIKALILMAPFLVMALLVFPFLPSFSFTALMVLWGVAFIFGFFVMVVSHDDDEDSRRARLLHGIGKFVFLILCSAAIAEIIKSRVLSGEIMVYMIVPLCFFGAKMFADVNITSLLYDIFKFPSDV